MKDKVGNCRINLDPYGHTATRLRAVAAQVVPTDDATVHREITIHPKLLTLGTMDLVEHILAGYVYHLNVMPHWTPACQTPARSALRAAYRNQAGAVACPPW
jgi:hypothetical protein